MDQYQQISMSGLWTITWTIKWHLWTNCNHLNTVQKLLGCLRVIFYHIYDHQICHFVWMMNNHLDIVTFCLVVPMAP